jgi:DNA-binding IclR family transcriptional regulator
VPITNAAGEAVAAVSLTGPSLRYTNDKIVEYAQLLKTAAKEISRRIM